MATATHADPIETLTACMDPCGQVPYGLAISTAAAYGLTNEFLALYGLPGDWEDPETGRPIGIDVGELIAWIEVN